MNLTSTFWYEIVYPDGQRLFFQFLDKTQEEQIRCRLCNGSIVTNIFRRQYDDIIEIGENSPCEPILYAN